jgi:hypothetical protein
MDIISNQGNASENNIEILLHPSQNGCHQENKTSSMSGREKKENKNNKYW